MDSYCSASQAGMVSFHLRQQEVGQRWKKTSDVLFWPLNMHTWACMYITLTHITYMHYDIHTGWQESKAVILSFENSHLI